MRRLCVRLAVLFTLSSVLYADDVPLQKPGRWEVTATLEVAGMDLKIPPKAMTFCLSSDDVKDPRKSVPLDETPEGNRSCVIGDVKVEGSKLTWTINCPGQKIRGDGQITFAGERYEGSMSMHGDDAPGMTMNYTGKWISPCEPTRQSARPDSAVPSGRTAGASSNEKRVPTAELQEFDQAKFEGGLYKDAWSLAIQYSHKDYPARTAKELAEDVASDAFLTSQPNLLPYKEVLPGLANRLGLLGGSLTYFLYGGKHTAFPFAVVRYKGQRCFVVYAATDNVLNTLRLTSAKQRASKIASTHGLPALRDLAKALKDTDIKAVAVFLAYGTKDFLDKSALATKAEVFGIVTSKDAALSFAAGEITDEELLAKSTALVSDRDAIFDFTKVDLNLK